VKKNIVKLKACELDDFSEISSDPPGRNLFTKYHCHNCGGTIDRSAYRWYLKGFEHGRKKAN